MKGNRLHITLANRNVSKHFDNVRKIQFNFTIDGRFQIYLSNGLNKAIDDMPTKFLPFDHRAESIPLVST